MKKIKIITITISLIFMTANPLFAYSDAEVRNEIQAYINTATLPQKIDDITQVNELLTSSRGIVYLYEINMKRDQFPLSAMDNMKKIAISTLCTNPALVWYKNNNVDMSYIYFDNKEDIISLFKINSKNC